MNKVTGIISISVLLIVSSCFFQKNNSVNVESNYAFLQIDSVIHLGKLHENIDTNFQIPVFNSGSDSLKVEEVESFCGCIRCEIDNPRLAPLDTLHLEVSLKPLYKGYMERELWIYFEKKNDPLRIKLKGFVK